VLGTKTNLSVLAFCSVRYLDVSVKSLDVWTAYCGMLVLVFTAYWSTADYQSLGR
jgi:hypothetical protein